MIYKYRVTLEGIKGFYRVYLVNGDNTLYTFHKQLRSDLEFALDQPILFKAFDENGAVAARYALIDLGYGTVDAISVAETVKAGITKFVYFYDTKSKKSVNITLEGIEEKQSVKTPTIVDTKGPLPIEFENGYVAFEDLPEEDKTGLHKKKKSILEIDLDSLGLDEDDEDLDDEEDEKEEDDEEKEEIIYDENEEM